MLSIRSKLTLWYLGIAASVLVAFAVALYVYLSNGILRAIDTSLWNQADRIAQATGHPSGNDEPSQPSGLVLAPQFVSVVNGDGEITDKILDAQGREVPIDKTVLERAGRDMRPIYNDVAITPAEQARTITWPSHDEDGDLFFVVIGQSLKELHQAQRELLVLLAISNPAGLLVASLGGLWIANKTLRPVDRLTRAAEHIGRGNLSERVEESGANDEIGRLAATFNEMIAKLEQAFDRERRFTADASHELKTPLAVLRGDIEVTLRRERAPEEYERVLRSNLEEIERLSRLTDDLLTLARSDSGERMIELAPVSLDQLAAEAYAYLLPLAERAGVALAYEAPPAPMVIDGDLKRLKQLLLNLLDNAIKYTPPGGDVRLRLRAEDGAAVIVVSDTGRGIPADVLPHVFERFYRQSDPRDARVTGFGLGLAISKWIVNAHGGAIEVDSQPGQGSRFNVRLPLVAHASTDV